MALKLMQLLSKTPLGAAFLSELHVEDRVPQVDRVVKGIPGIVNSPASIRSNPVTQKTRALVGYIGIN